MYRFFLPLFLLLISLQLRAQDRKVTGTVFDEATGNPLAYASVNIKGTSAGTNADPNGYFMIKLPPRTVDLVVTCVGYEKKEVRVTDSATVVSIGLEAIETKMMESVVVTVAYGQARHGGKRIQGKVPQKTANSESYKKISENGFITAACEPVSTFAADVDHASYSNVRRIVKEKSRPVPDAIRVEEMINYFDYDYAAPSGKQPYAIYTELTECPWQPGNRLMRVALKSAAPQITEYSQNNLVLLIDVSGSMGSPNKLQLAVESFKLLLDSLQPEDRVAIVTYAGKSGVALESTPVSEKETIIKALDKLSTGGRTAGSAGIELAYETAQTHFIEGGNNRVILATDGDFNVGVTSYEALQSLIEREKNGGVYLTCLGFGAGNYKDDIMEVLANKGNGNYYYIDQLSEARRVLQHDFRGTLNTVAEDVKIQVEFNPRFVKSYRLIGYENRLLKNEDFDNDAKDAGELGAGSTVTVLYEIVPATENEPSAKTDSLKCDKNPFSPESNQLAAIRTRYKLPAGMKGRSLDFFVINNAVPFNGASANTRLAAAVAMWGLWLRHSAYAASANPQKIIPIAQSVPGNERVREFVQLVNISAEQ